MGDIFLHNLRPDPGSKHGRKRVGRGEGSGIGKTSGRGHKGSKQRSGGQISPRYEGGQMPLHMRLPKLKGFKNNNKVEFQVVNLVTEAGIKQVPIATRISTIGASVPLRLRACRAVSIFSGLVAWSLFHGLPGVRAIRRGTGGSPETARGHCGPCPFGMWPGK